MGEWSKISWCHHTFNPWIGCFKVSDECDLCYAEVNTFTRYQRSMGRELWGKDADRHVVSEAKWAEPRRWNRDAQAAGVRRRVFCASMADVLEPRPDLVAPRARLCKLIENTPWLDWLLLTKRPEHQRLLPAEWLAGDAPPNVWFGATIGVRKSLWRLRHVQRATWAAVRFVSMEPLLELVVLPSSAFDVAPRARLNWAITGEESGGTIARPRRPMNEDHVRALRDQCVETGTSFFYKQKLVGALKIETPMLDGRRWAEFPR